MARTGRGWRERSPGVVGELCDDVSVILMPVAGVVAWTPERQLVMVRRGDDGAWALPAGRMEPGESWLECAVREFREETGMSVEITGLLGVYSEPGVSRHTYPDGRDVQFLGVVFEGHVDGVPPPVSSLGEITAVEYFAPERLPEPPARLFGRVVIEDALSEHRRPVVR